VLENGIRKLTKQSSQHYPQVFTSSYSLENTV